MAHQNYGFAGFLPADYGYDMSIQDNLERALNYQSTRTEVETLDWIYNVTK